MLLVPKYLPRKQAYIVQQIHSYHTVSHPNIPTPALIKPRAQSNQHQTPPILDPTCASTCSKHSSSASLRKSDTSSTLFGTHRPQFTQFQFHAQLLASLQQASLLTQTLYLVRASPFSVSTCVSGFHLRSPPGEDDYVAATNADADDSTRLEMEME